jgi:predicted deacylase
MPPLSTARRIRIGGVTLAPGEAKVVALSLAARPARKGGTPDAAAARAVPAWVVVGAKAGPRVSIVAAPRGTETAAAAAARALARSLDPAALAGSVVIVPVLRPGGRFAPRRRPGAAWRFPGEPGGGPRARDAFALFSELVVGAGAVLVLGAPRGGRRAALTAEGDLDDPRVQRLAAACGTHAARQLPRKKPARGTTLVAAARAARVVALELHAAGPPADDTRAARLLEEAVTAGLTSLGLLAASDGARADDGVRPMKPATAKPVRVRAPAGGLIESGVEPGAVVRAGSTLGHVSPTLPGRAHPLLSPVDAVVLETPGRAAARKGTPLFVLAPLAPGVARRRLRAAPAGAPATGPGAPAKLRAGWVEHVTLPDLAIPRLKAKIDTGARTSALHVVDMRTVDTAGGPHRRPILEITVPGGGRGRKPHLVRAAVRGYAVVRDTSGRTERRPVIETALRLGPLKKRIAVTLTNRGDMLYPMLIGRTALGTGVVVDPSRRYLLG